MPVAFAALSSGRARSDPRSCRCGQSVAAFATAAVIPDWTRQDDPCLLADLSPGARPKCAAATPGQELEFLTKPCDVSPGDDAGGEAEEGFVDVVSAFP